MKRRALPPRPFFPQVREESELAVAKLFAFNERIDGRAEPRGDELVALPPNDVWCASVNSRPPGYRPDCGPDRSWNLRKTKLRKAKMWELTNSWARMSPSLESWPRPTTSGVTTDSSSERRSFWSTQASYISRASSLSCGRM